MGCCGSVLEEDPLLFQRLISKSSVTLTKTDPSQCCSPYISEEYILGKSIGSGSFSQVLVGIHKTTQSKVAIKVISRQNLTTGEDLAVKHEVAILKRLDHPAIIKLIDYQMDDHYHYLVLEHMHGGELFKKIASKEHYSECEAKRICHSILEAIAYIHQQGVVHRDIKPENLLLTSNSDDALIKLADFGLAVEKADRLRALVGSPFYVAPEIIKGQLYSEKVDIWSFGVIVYIMLCGYPPFYRRSTDELLQVIQTGKYTFTLPPWPSISKNAKELIKVMLNLDPTKRPTAKELLQHPWFNTSPEQKVPLPSTITNLHKFSTRRKFKAVIHEVIATHRFCAPKHPPFYDYCILASPGKKKGPNTESTTNLQIKQVEISSTSLQTNLQTNLPTKQIEIPLSNLLTKQIEIPLSNLQTKQIEIPLPLKEIVEEDTLQTKEEILPILKEDILPILKEDILPILSEDILPILNEDILPILNEEILPILNEETEYILASNEVNALSNQEEDSLQGNKEDRLDVSSAVTIP